MTDPERGQELDERDAVARARSGDQDAFAYLVRQHEALAFRAAFLIVRDEAEAQDVAQEAFVRAYQALGRFDAAQPFRPWLLRIVTNLALNSLRGSRRRNAAGDRYERDATRPASFPSPEATVAARDEARAVWEAIAALTAGDQQVLYLRYFLGASERETAIAIGRPEGTVKSRLHRALGRLRGVIEERHPHLMPRAIEELR